MCVMIDDVAECVDDDGVMTARGKYGAPSKQNTEEREKKKYTVCTNHTRFTTV